MDRAEGHAGKPTTFYLGSIVWLSQLLESKGAQSKKDLGTPLGEALPPMLVIRLGEIQLSIIRPIL